MGNSINGDLNKEMSGAVLLHRFRYHIGAGFVSPSDMVIDAACGQAYGTLLLSNKADHVFGIDIEESQIEANQDKYNGKNITFIAGNLEEIDLPDCDVACSFETIEHLYKPELFIKKLKNVTKKYIIASVPFGCEKLIEVDGDIQADLDSTHHSVFGSPLELDMMFIDKKWKKFYGFTTGVTYICAYYNKDNL